MVRYRRLILFAVYPLARHAEISPTDSNELALTKVAGNGTSRMALQAELQKSHGYAGITREEGLQNGQSVRKVSCQHTT